MLPRRFRSSAPWRAPAVRVGLPSTPGPSQDRLIDRRADDAEIRWGGHGETSRSSASGVTDTSALGVTLNSRSALTV